MPQKPAKNTAPQAMRSATASKPLYSIPSSTTSTKHKVPILPTKLLTKKKPRRLSHQGFLC